MRCRMSGTWPTGPRWSTARGSYGAASNNYIYYCGPNYTKPCADQHNPPPGSTKVLHGVSIPQSLFNSVPVGNFIPGYKGGNLPSSLPMFDPYAVLNYLIKQ